MTKRYDHIDALRALAAVLVLWTHTSQAFTYVTDQAIWFYELSLNPDAGRIGVVVFFVVSGFVIPSSLASSAPKLAIVRSFVIRRFFRLYPVYWMSIPLGLWAFHSLYDKSVAPATLLANATMIQDFLGYESVLGVYWTLQTELVFYAACVILFMTVGLRSNLVISTVTAALLALHIAGAGDARLNLLLAHLSLMFLGTLLRRWHDAELPGRWRGVVVALSAFWLASPVFGQGDPAYGIAVGLFLLGAFVIRVRHPAVVAVGRASYALYLFHAVVFWPIVWLLQQPALEPLRGLPLPVYVLFAAAAEIAVALAIYRWIELPLIDFGRKAATRAPGPKVVDVAL